MNYGACFSDKSDGHALPRLLDFLALFKSKAHIHATRISTPLQIITFGKKNFFGTML